MRRVLHIKAGSTIFRRSAVLGVIELDENISDSAVPSDIPFYSNLGELFVGQKRYELSNHLGNVLAVVNDRKNENVTGTTVNFSEPTIISANDYYPFGLQMDQRSFTLVGAKGHRYGFNDD